MSEVYFDSSGRARWAGGNVTVTPDQAAAAIGEVIQTFSHEVVTCTDEAALEVGKLAAQELKKKNFGAKAWKKYPKGWTVKKDKKGTVIVWNSTDYRLTHLLEKGHRTNYKSGVFGTKQETRAFPHIAQVETMVQEKFPEYLSRKIQMQK